MAAWSAYMEVVSWLSSKLNILVVNHYRSEAIPVVMAAREIHSNPMV